MAATMFLDVLWPIFLLLGIEHVNVVPGITAFCPFDFVSYPWSHSLVMAIVWSLAFGGGHYLLRHDAATAKVMGAVVFSHWILDWVTHRPDLQLAPGIQLRVGAGLWNSIPATLVVEGAMFLGAAWWYERATQALDGVGRWAWYSFIGVLLILYVAGLGPPPPAGHEKLIALVTIASGIIIPWAAWIDRHRAFRG